MTTQWYEFFSLCQSNTLKKSIFAQWNIKRSWEKHLSDFKTKYLAGISVDLVIFGFHDGQLKILLLRWKETDDWCLPGGRIQHDESVESAAYRSLSDRTGLSELFLQQFHTFGGVMRYTNFDAAETAARLGFTDGIRELLSERVVSVGYYALVDYAEVSPTPRRVHRGMPLVGHRPDSAPALRS